MLGVFDQAYRNFRILQGNRNLILCESGEEIDFMIRQFRNTEIKAVLANQIEIFWVLILVIESIAL